MIYPALGWDNLQLTPDDMAKVLTSHSYQSRCEVPTVRASLPQILRLVRGSCVSMMIYANPAERFEVYGVSLHTVKKGPATTSTFNALGRRTLQRIRSRSVRTHNLWTLGVVERHGSEKYTG